jgi:bifunctional NMN adenylyltransferase/nudix hydrolase
MTKRYKLAVLIGRFEPFHNGHLSNLIQAMDIADHVQILIGSSYQPRTPKNPFTFAERCEMIMDALGVSAKIRGSSKHNYSISPIRDFKYSDNTWIAQVQQNIADHYPGIEDRDICILGFDKDESSWYNHAFPEWNFVPLSGFVEHGSRPIDATKIRELFFDGHLDFVAGAVPETVFDYLKQFQNTEHYNELVEEHVFYRDYHKKWAAAPFVPTFQTVDAVVIQGGHILMIQRGHSPGKGLWALPGGFLNPKENLETAAVRELVEETRIKVPRIVLEKAMTYSKRFAHPDRDLRGRTITEAFLFELTGGDGKLPKVKGDDDAREARWFKLAEIDTMEELIYSDHKHIIDTLVARARK